MDLQNNDPVLDSYRYANNLTNVLLFNMDFFMDTVDFSHFHSDYYFKARQVQKALNDLREEYAKNLKFNPTNPF